MSLAGNLEAGGVLRGKINDCDLLTISAYGIAVKNGFCGTEAEWLKTLEMSPEEVDAAVADYLTKNPVAIDDTLSITGEAADAKATGDAIAALRKASEDSVTDHVSHKNNPHEVTKTHVGLGRVDNTPDAEKPVSAAQAKAIDDAKTEAINVANNAQTAANNAQTTADNAQTAADEAMSLARSREAQHQSVEITLLEDGWIENSQVVSVSGVTALGTVIISAAPANYDEYCEAGVRCVAQTDGVLTFKCNDVPKVPLAVNVVIMGVGASGGNGTEPVMLNMDILEDGYSVRAEVGDEIYGIKNATVNQGATEANYDFTIL